MATVKITLTETQARVMLRALSTYVLTTHNTAHGDYNREANLEWGHAIALRDAVRDQITSDSSQWTDLPTRKV